MKEFPIIKIIAIATWSYYNYFSKDHDTDLSKLINASSFESNYMHEFDAILKFSGHTTT